MTLPILNFKSVQSSPETIPPRELLADLKSPLTLLKAIPNLYVVVMPGTTRPDGKKEHVVTVTGADVSEAYIATVKGNSPVTVSRCPGLPAGNQAHTQKLEEILNGTQQSTDTKETDTKEWSHFAMSTRLRELAKP